MLFIVVLIIAWVLRFLLYGFGRVCFVCLIDLCGVVRLGCRCGALVGDWLLWFYIWFGGLFDSWICALIVLFMAYIYPSLAF